MKGQVSNRTNICAPTQDVSVCPWWTGAGISRFITRHGDFMRYVGCVLRRTPTFYEVGCISPCATLKPPVGSLSPRPTQGRRQRPPPSHPALPCSASVQGTPCSL